jgi:hypothetical protein
MISSTREERLPSSEKTKEKGIVTVPESQPLSSLPSHPLRKLIGRFEDLLNSDYEHMSDNMRKIFDTHRIKLQLEKRRINIARPATVSFRKSSRQ